MVIWGESSHTDVLFFKSPVTASRWSFGVKVHTLTWVFSFFFKSPVTASRWSFGVKVHRLTFFEYP